jgi:hypothetical protein
VRFLDRIRLTTIRLTLSVFLYLLFPLQSSLLGRQSQLVTVSDRLTVQAAL